MFCVSVNNASFITMGRFDFMVHYTHLVLIPPHCSVVILAFVKSEGKVTSKKSNDAAKDETSGLLSDQTDSLEGSLRDRVVR